MIELAFKLLLTFTIICINSFKFELAAQECFPFRIGVKAGWPEVAGLDAEYVSPLLNKKLSIDVDVSYIPLPLSDFTTTANGNVTYTNYSGSFNYYIFKQGEGIYAGIGISIMNIDVSGNQIDSIPKKIPFIGGNKLNFTGTASKVIDSYFIKIGGKYGKHYYFSWEVGYKISPGNNTDKIIVYGSLPGLPFQALVTTVNIPSYLISGPVADVGFGITF